MKKYPHSNLLCWYAKEGYDYGKVLESLRALEYPSLSGEEWREFEASLNGKYEDFWEANGLAEVPYSSRKWSTVGIIMKDPKIRLNVNLFHLGERDADEVKEFFSRGWHVELYKNAIELYWKFAFDIDDVERVDLAAWFMAMPNRGLGRTFMRCITGQAEDVLEHNGLIEPDLDIKKMLTRLIKKAGKRTEEALDLPGTSDVSLHAFRFSKVVTDSIDGIAKLDAAAMKARGALDETEYAVVLDDAKPPSLEEHNKAMAAKDAEMLAYYREHPAAVPEDGD